MKRLTRLAVALLALLLAAPIVSAGPIAFGQWYEFLSGAHWRRCTWLFWLL